ncbi:MAG: phage portal protein [Clostridia bacterium]|nr:phage portal protein [Clostridia bacterium]
MDIRTLLNKMNIEVVDVEGGKSDIKLWNSWYKGCVSEVHKYSVYNGVKKVSQTRKSLRMAKRVCEDWANLLLNEKVVISVNNEESDKVLKDVLKKNNFCVNANRLIEISFALGTGAFVESRRDGKVKIDFVRAEYIYPLSCEGGVITGCAFGQEIKNGKKRSYYIQAHVPNENGGYDVHNGLFDENGVALPLGDAVEVVFHSEKKLFQIITPNKVNARRTDSPFGASVFSDALDVLAGIDITFDSFINEFKLGKKRLVVPMSMAKKMLNEKGEMIPVFDSNDVAFYAMEGSEEEKSKLQEIDMNLRIEEHINALECILSVLSDRCGLGSGRYSYKERANAVKTAEEVISDKSELYQNIKKHELVLEDALISMADAILFLSGMPENEASVMFDDSIIENKAAEFTKYMELQAAGDIAPWEVRMWWTGESEKEAKKACEEIAEGFGDE